MTNNTGQTITALRFRVIDITTLFYPGYVPGGGQADVRALSSLDVVVTLSNGQTVTVKGTTLEQPPLQSLGGGLNPSLKVALPPGGLAQSVPAICTRTLFTRAAPVFEN